MARPPPCFLLFPKTFFSFLALPSLCDKIWVQMDDGAQGTPKGTKTTKGKLNHPGNQESPQGNPAGRASHPLFSSSFFLLCSPFRWKRDKESPLSSNWSVFPPFAPRSLQILCPNPGSTPYSSLLFPPQILLHLSPISFHTSYSSSPLQPLVTYSISVQPLSWCCPSSSPVHITFVAMY